jgi:hypothetical protein
VTGVAGEPIRLVACGRLSAAVGELQRCPRATRDRLVRYAETVHSLSRQLTAVLPARFGTCVADLDELMFILRSRQASLMRALGLVRHRVQMTVRVLPETGTRGSGLGTRLLHVRTNVGSAEVLATEIASASPEPRAPSPERSGRAYLQSRAAEAARERDIPGFDPVRLAVRRWVRDERVEKRLTVATVYHLIPRASVPAYRRAVRSAAAAAGVRVVVSGPFPPYAFASA